MVSHNITNYDTFISLTGMLRYGSSTYITINALSGDPMTGTISTSKFNEFMKGGVRLFVNSSTLLFFPTDKGSYTIHVILEYTKTTD